jgi:Xaa-Pro aminopeptidase
LEVPGYSLAERDRRWALAREFMAAEEVDALIACGEHECEWAGGVAFAPDAYLTNDRPGSVVIFCRDADPVRLAWRDPPAQTEPEPGPPGGQTWIEPARIHAGRDLRHGAITAGIVEVLREHHLESAAVGLLGPDTVPPGHLNCGLPSLGWRDVAAELPGVTFRLVGRGFMLAAICLSEEELAVLRYCAAAGESMARAMLEAAAPGVTEAQVYAAGTAAALRLGCQAPPMPMWSGPGLAAWGQPGWWYRPEPPRVLGEGDVLLGGAACRLGTLETRHPVAIAVGDPHPDIETAAVIARASYEAGLRAARVGSTVGDLAEAMLAPLKVSGARSTHPLVHALTPLGPAGGSGRAGGQSHVPWARCCGRLPGIPAIGGDLPLAPGMPWAFAPSAVIGGRAVTLGGTVVIAEDGPIELSPFTARLLRVGSTRPPVGVTAPEASGTRSTR